MRLADAVLDACRCDVRAPLAGDHAEKDGDDRPANDGKGFPQKPGRQGNDKAECDAWKFRWIHDDCLLILRQ